MDTLKAWGLVAAGVLVVLGGVFFSLPPMLDHWDKARAQTRIEIREKEAIAKALLNVRLEAAKQKAMLEQESYFKPVSAR